MMPWPRLILGVLISRHFFNSDYIKPKNCRFSKEGIVGMGCAFSP